MDEIVADIEKDLRDVNKISSLMEELIHAAETEKNVDSFQKALLAVSNALKTNQKNESFVTVAVNFYARIVEMKQCRSLVESSSIHTQLLNLLTITKDNPKTCYGALSIIHKTMEIPRLCPYYSNSQFISLLVYIARINTKSFKHIKLISKVSRNLSSRLGEEYKDLCNIFLTILRSLQATDQRQVYLMSAICHLSNGKILAEIGGVAVPLFTEICMEQSNSFTLAKYLFDVVYKSTAEQFDPNVLSIIEIQEKKIREDKETLKIVVNILASKNDPKNTPPFVVPIAYSALQSFVSDKSIIEDALTVCFRGLTASENVRISPSLPTVVTSLMTMYMRDKGIIRRCAAILHTMSADSDNDLYLSFSAAADIIVQTINANLDDQHSILICTSALFNVIADNEILAQQVNTTDNINILKSVAKKYKSKPKIIKNVVETMFSLMLTEYDVKTFIDLPNEMKAKYQIDSKLVLPLLNEEPDDKDFVLCCFSLMTNSPKNAETIANIMLKYTQDTEIVLAAFSHDIKDIGAINRGLMTLQENGIRYVHKTLLEAKNPLPSQVISLLLSFDRQDSIEILQAQIKNGNDSVIANQLHLTFVSQVPLAKALLDRKLWKPTEEDTPIILQSLAYSKFDPERLYDSLVLLHTVGLTVASYPLLLDIIGQFPHEEEIVAECCAFINDFQATQEFIDVTNKYDGIQKMISAIDGKKKEPTIYSILKFISLISSFPDLYVKFYEPIILMKIAEVANTSDRCSIEVSRIFSNLSKSHIIIDILLKLGALSIAFGHFGPSSYQLVHSIIASGSQVLSDQQVEQILEEFNSKITSVSNEDAKALILLVLDLFDTDALMEDIPNIKVISQLFSMYSRDQEIIRNLARLVSFIDEFYLNEEIVFSLVNAMKTNIKDFQTVFSIVDVLSKVPYESEKPATFDSQSIIQSLVDVIIEYYNDSSICTPLFRLLFKRKEAFDAAVKALNPEKDSEDLAVIAQYLFGCGIWDYNEILPTIFDVIKMHSYSFEIVTFLAPVIYYAADSEDTHKLIASNAQILLDLSVRFIYSNRLSRAIPATLCRITENQDFIPMLEAAPPYIVMILKAWPKDSQIVQASTCLITNFACAGKASLFTCALPLITAELRQIDMVSYMCEAIASLSDVLGGYGIPITEKLFELLSDSHIPDEASDEEEELDEKSLISNTLYTLSKNDSIEDVIYSKLDDAFAIAENADENDDIRVNVLKFCSSIHSQQKVDKFQPYIERLLTLLEGKKIKVAIAAGQCVLQIATLKTPLVDPYINRIMNIAKSTSGELLRVCLAIKDQIYGLKIPIPK